MSFKWSIFQRKGREVIWYGGQSPTWESEGMGIYPALPLTHCMILGHSFTSLELKTHVWKMRGLDLIFSKVSSISEDQTFLLQAYELRFHTVLWKPPTKERPPHPYKADGTSGIGLHCASTDSEYGNKVQGALQKYKKYRNVGTTGSKNM